MADPNKIPIQKLYQRDPNQEVHVIEAPSLASGTYTNKSNKRSSSIWSMMKAFWQHSDSIVRAL